MNKSSTRLIQHPPNQIDKKVLDEVRRRFVLLSQYRWQRLRDESTSGRRLLLDALAILLHENHPRLPGYIGKHAPSGIIDFNPNKFQIAAAKRLSRSYQYQRRASHQSDILALYLMGSAGTLGEEPNSDLDIWVFHRPDLSTEAVNALQQKAAAIELWAESLGVDLHLYIMPPDYFQQTDTAPIDQEHCGTSQRRLLLEEFYRTHAWIAGAYPIWWLVPPNEEHNYQPYVNRLIQQRFLDTRTWLDIGDISLLPKEEFLGAALWHLHKSVESPYKSNLKMMLMEAYFAQAPSFMPVATELKREIYLNHLDPRLLDPYAAMYRHVERTLLAENRPEALEWVRHCLYMKTNTRLATRQGRSKLWRAHLLADLCRQWGWDEYRIRQHDRLMTRPDFYALRNERSQLMRHLFECYHRLKQYYRASRIRPAISEADLNAIGRRLTALFEHAPDKIEQLHLGFLRHYAETEVTVVQGNDHWHLYSGLLDQIPTGAKPLSRQPSFCRLMAWGIANQVVQRETNWRWLNQPDNVLVARARALVRRMTQRWPFEQTPPPLAQFKKPSRVQKAVWIVNAPPLAPENRKRQLWIVANMNPLSFGKSQENFLCSLDLITGDSWGQIHHRRFSGTAALTGHFMTVKDWHQKDIEPEQIWLSSPGPYSEMLKTYLKQINHLWKQCLSENGRLLVKLGTQFLLLDGQTGEISAADDVDGLLANLAERHTPAIFQPLIVAPHTLQNEPLAVLCTAGARATWECHIQHTKSHTVIWFVDELGGIARYPCANHTYVAHLAALQAWLTYLAQQTTPTPTIRWFKVEYDDSGWRRQEISPAHQRASYTPIDVMLHVDNGVAKLSTLQCGEQQFNFTDSRPFKWSALHELDSASDHRPPPLVRYCRLVGDRSINTAALLQLKHQLEQSLNARPFA